MRPSLRSVRRPLWNAAVVRGSAGLVRTTGLLQSLVSPPGAKNAPHGFSIHRAVQSPKTPGPQPSGADPATPARRRAQSYLARLVASCSTA